MTTANHHTTRSEHMDWAKGRAFDELDRSGPSAAIASMQSDVTKHPDTVDLAPFVTISSLHLGSVPEVRRWIEGFAS